jgi:hypothetical protein
MTLPVLSHRHGLFRANGTNIRRRHLFTSVDVIFQIEFVGFAERGAEKTIPLFCRSGMGIRSFVIKRRTPGRIKSARSVTILVIRRLIRLRPFDSEFQQNHGRSAPFCAALEMQWRHHQ